MILLFVEAKKAEYKEGNCDKYWLESIWANEMWDIVTSGKCNEY